MAVAFHNEYKFYFTEQILVCYSNVNKFHIMFKFLIYLKQW